MMRAFRDSFEDELIVDTEADPDPIKGYVPVSCACDIRHSNSIGVNGEVFNTYFEYQILFGPFCARVGRQNVYGGHGVG